MRGYRQAVWTMGLLSAALLTPGVAQAQGRGGMGGGGMNGPGLIALPAVQKELKLSDEQAEKARTFAAQYREKAQEAMSQYADLSGDERMTKMQTVNRTMSAAGMKDVEAMLKPEQTKRFKQIVFQARGVDNLNDPETAKALKVTSEQADKVKNLLEGQRGEMREAQQSAGGDRQALMEKMTAIRKETTTKAMTLMTADQKTMFKEMAGEPFELPAMGGRGAPR